MRNWRRIKLQELNLWLSRVAHEQQPVKRSCVEHMTGRRIVMPDCHFCNCLTGRAYLQKTHESHFLSFLQLSHRKGLPAKDSRKSLFGKKLCFASPFFYLHYIYPHYLQILSNDF